MIDPEIIAEFLKTLRTVESGYRLAKKEESEAENQLQDIAHRLEIYTDPYHEIAKLGKLFRQIRRIRRKAKEEQEFSEPIISWMENNKQALKSLEKLLGTLRHIREIQEKRSYWPRSHILDYMTDGEQKRMRADSPDKEAAGGNSREKP